ncbi:MAG: NUDIX domain-containing protein [Kiritimatiellae bacterium]|nr:NUDIX domain-containing protein [Kiritimatiellia bacterium]
MNTAPVETTRIEVIARGVCLVDGQLLLCRGKGAPLSYLPGGHVEFRETARHALEREILEELGMPSKAGRFLGCCENSFLQKGEPHAEINLVFELQIPGASPAEPLAATESWIGFEWHPLVSLGDAGLVPAPLRAQLTRWLSAPGGHVDCGDQWLDIPPEHL